MTPVETDVKMYVSVYEIVKEAMNKQDAATYMGESSSPDVQQACHKATGELMALIKSVTRPPSTDPDKRANVRMHVNNAMNNASILTKQGTFNEERAAYAAMTINSIMEIFK